MKINFEVEHYNYSDRYRNLDVEAKGIVKSQKFFPVFLNNGREEIFKPLSKTKPLLTPFFAYSEVFWSNIINKYFDSTAPIYRLAICEGYSDEVPKYNDHGTIVPSILNEGEILVNLYEYFKENKDIYVNIEDYVNFCMKTYDYTCIFKSQLFSENKKLGEQLALQVLLSILKADQNYHYENVGLIFKNGELISLAPPIDHEFSTMFLYLDDLVMNRAQFDEYVENFNPEDLLAKNLDFIVDEYEDVVIRFLNILEVLIHDLKSEPVEFFDNGYLYPFNTNNFRAGIAQYKNNNVEAAKEILSSLKQYMLDISQVNNIIKVEVIELATALQEYLINRIEIKHQKTLEFK